MKTALQWALVLGLLFPVACSKNSISERDSKREQLKNSAETKRKELLIVAGNYRGVLSQTGFADRVISLYLEVKDVPTLIEGDVDPVPVPTLKGYLRLFIGDETEYEGFSVERADFEPKKGKLDTVVSHPQYKDIIIAAQLVGSKLTGTWTAPSSSSTGSLEVTKQ